MCSGDSRADVTLHILRGYSSCQAAANNPNLQGDPRVFQRLSCSSMADCMDQPADSQIVAVSAHVER